MNHHYIVLYIIYNFDDIFKLLHKNIFIYNIIKNNNQTIIKYNQMKKLTYAY